MTERQSEIECPRCKGEGTLIAAWIPHGIRVTCATCGGRGSVDRARFETQPRVFDFRRGGDGDSEVAREMQQEGVSVRVLSAPDATAQTASRSDPTALAQQPSPSMMSEYRRLYALNEAMKAYHISQAASEGESGAMRYDEIVRLAREIEFFLRGDSSGGRAE